LAPTGAVGFEGHREFADPLLHLFKAGVVRFGDELALGPTSRGDQRSALLTYARRVSVISTMPSAPKTRLHP
jgi:hypothetical protein